MPRAFPDGFSWGTATAAHQIEGGNWNNDWWDVGAHARLGLRRAVRRRLRLLAPLAPRTSPSSPTSASTTTGSRSSGAASSPRRASGRRPPSTTTAAQCEALLAAGVDPVVTFHHFTTPRWVARQGRLDRARHRRPLRRVLRPRSPASSATCIAPGVHDQRAEHRVDDGPPRRRVPARAPRRRSCAATVNGVFVDAHRKAVDAIRAAAPGVPVGLTLSMTDYQAVDGGEAQARPHPLPHGGRVPRGRPTGDDFVGVQTYSPHRASGPTAPLGNEEGVDVLLDGLRVLARVARRRRSAGRGR